MTTLQLEESRVEARRAMVDEQCRARGIHDERVLSVMAELPRELFISEELSDEAYADRALPIDYAQTISQPYIVALMTEALELRPEHVVLEIGTGSGYQTAVLARLARHVVTVERIPALSHSARARLDGLGIGNVSYQVGDGSLGLPLFAPYDRIIVTAGAPSVAPALLQQLRYGGRLVVPVGDENTQTLLVQERHPDRTIEQPLVPCRFVKLVGRAGWPTE